MWSVTNYGHVMSRTVSYLKQANLFSSKSFLNFCDPSSRFLINWFLIKKNVYMFPVIPRFNSWNIPFLKSNTCDFVSVLCICVHVHIRHTTEEQGDEIENWNSLKLKSLKLKSNLFFQNSRLKKSSPFFLPNIGNVKMWKWQNVWPTDPPPPLTN